MYLPYLRGWREQSSIETGENHTLLANTRHARQTRHDHMNIAHCTMCTKMVLSCGICSINETPSFWILFLLFWAPSLPFPLQRSRLPSHQPFFLTWRLPSHLPRRASLLSWQPTVPGSPHLPSLERLLGSRIFTH